MAAQNKSTISIQSFDEVPKSEYPSIPLIVVYDNPLDFPGMFVARLWNINKPTPYAVIKKTFKEIQKTIPKHMMDFPPHEMDDPKIIMTYI